MTDDVGARIVDELVAIKKLIMLDLQEAHGWSQRDLAAKIGINQSTISRMFTGRGKARAAGSKRRSEEVTNGSRG